MKDRSTRRGCLLMLYLCVLISGSGLLAHANGGYTQEFVSPDGVLSFEIPEWWVASSIEDNDGPVVIISNSPQAIYQEEPVEGAATIMVIYGTADFFRDMMGEPNFSFNPNSFHELFFDDLDYAHRTNEVSMAGIDMLETIVAFDDYVDGVLYTAKQGKLWFVILCAAPIGKLVDYGWQFREIIESMEISSS